MSKGFDASWRDYQPAGSVPVKKRSRYSKYGAVPHTVLPDMRVLPTEECGAVAGGIRFDSKREAERFVALRQQQERGEISCLTLQQPYTLHAVNSQGVKVPLGAWVSDFTYSVDGRVQVEDCKGFRTALYLWKKRHVEREYDIAIIES